MEAALQRRVQRYGWDKASTYYENTWQQQLKPAHDALFALAKIEAGEKIIDVACGTGLITFRALEATAATGFVLGTDLSDKMVEMSTKTATENNLLNVTFERMDAEELKLPDEEFDVALCALGLMYVPSPINALKEMYRVLKPRGRCISAVWGKRISCGWADIFEIVDKRVSSEVCPMFFNLGNEPVLEKNFETAGFSKIYIERISTVLQYHSADEACAAAFEGGPVALAYFKFTPDVQKAACEDYLASIEQYRNGNTYDVPGEFVIGTGIK
ncbi:MAG: class I SAM-dependent methyltransferase [Ferruginibacter sp.]|nr:class I SAM-dependent methyltransferase [Ferruginibacter sp.]